MPANLSITQKDFQLLLGWLGTTAESGGEKYEKIRQRLIRIFVGRGCHEAELLADETIDRVIAKVPQISATYVGEPAAYFYGVAHKVHLEWLRHQQQHRETELLDSAAETKVEEDEAEYSCLESCLDELPKEAREIIVEYYRDEKRAKIERRKGLAQRLGISIGALQIKASRIRARLSTCVTNCVEGR